MATRFGAFHYRGTRCAANYHTLAIRLLTATTWASGSARFAVTPRHVGRILRELNTSIRHADVPRVYILDNETQLDPCCFDAMRVPRMRDVQSECDPLWRLK